MKDEFEQKRDNFHAHLDECARCRNQPFNLCATGQRLLEQAAGATAPPHADGLPRLQPRRRQR